MGSESSHNPRYYRATQIGADSYASKLANEARRFALAPSELRRGVNKILRWQLIIIPPTAILLFIRLVNKESWQESMTGMVAATLLVEAARPFLRKG